MFAASASIAWAAVLAVYDWRWRRLPNWLLLCGMGVGLVHGAIHGTMPFGATLSDGAGTAVVALAVYWPAYQLGWMGAGDVKFCAVIGWLGGAKTLLMVLLAGTVIAGLLGVLLLLPGMSEYLSNSELEPRLRRRIPFGSGLAVAFVAWSVVNM